MIERNSLLTLPAAAWIEQQILSAAQASGALEPFVRQAEKANNVPPGSLGRGLFQQTRTTFLLYSLLVLPHSIWTNRGEMKKLLDGLQSPLARGIQVTRMSGKSVLPLSEFLRHLRNAVSHANYDFHGQDFLFWDKSKAGTKIFEATLSNGQLTNLINDVGKRFANAALARRVP